MVIVFVNGMAMVMIMVGVLPKAMVMVKIIR